jgi:hypothetical protein
LPTVLLADLGRGHPKAVPGSLYDRPYEGALVLEGVSQGYVELHAQRRGMHRRPQLQVRGISRSS